MMWMLWISLLVVFGGLALCGLWFLHRRAWSRSTHDEDIRRHVNKNYDRKPAQPSPRSSVPSYEGHLFPGMSRPASAGFFPRESLILVWVVGQPETSNHLLQLYRLAGQ